MHLLLQQWMDGYLHQVQREAGFLEAIMHFLNQLLDSGTLLQIYLDQEVLIHILLRSEKLSELKIDFGLLLYLLIEVDSE